MFPNFSIERFGKKGGKRLVFGIKNGTDNTLLWKATIKIGCVLVSCNFKSVINMFHRLDGTFGGSLGKSIGGL